MTFLLPANEADTLVDNRHPSHRVMTVCGLQHLLLQPLKTLPYVGFQDLPAHLNGYLTVQFLVVVKKGSEVNPYTFHFQGPVYRINVVKHVMSCVEKETGGYSFELFWPLLIDLLKLSSNDGEVRLSFKPTFFQLNCRSYIGHFDCPEEILVVIIILA